MNDTARDALEALAARILVNANPWFPAEKWATELREIAALSAQPASVQGEADVPDGMWRISKLIAKLQGIQSRFGDTCVWMRECKWGATAMHAEREAEQAIFASAAPTRPKVSREALLEAFMIYADPQMVRVTYSVEKLRALGIEVQE